MPSKRLEARQWQSPLSKPSPHTEPQSTEAGCPTLTIIYGFYRESKQLYLIYRNKHREPDKLRRQRNMAQMKGQIKTPEKELSKMEIASLSDAQFKTLVIRMLRELTEYGQKHKGRNEGYTK